MKKYKEMPLRGGPKDGTVTDVYVAYLNKEGKPVSNDRGDRMRRSGTGGLYYNRGGYYEWNGREN